MRELLRTTIVWAVPQIAQDKTRLARCPASLQVNSCERKEEYPAFEVSSARYRTLPAQTAKPPVMDQADGFALSPPYNAGEASLRVSNPNTSRDCAYAKLCISAGSVAQFRNHIRSSCIASLAPWPRHPPSPQPLFEVTAASRDAMNTEKFEGEGWRTLWLAIAGVMAITLTWNVLMLSLNGISY